MQGLTPTTEVVFTKISSLDCLKPFTLVGGTALALQIGCRQSEDLDFMMWRTHKDEKMDVNWPYLKESLETVTEIESFNLMDFDHVEFVCEGVKLSFYATGRYQPDMHPIHILNNIKAADIKAIGAMKLEVMSRRNNFRDYYDVYCILQAGMNLSEMIAMAVAHSGHHIKTKNLIAIISDGSRFDRDINFEQLQPSYQITSGEIEQVIRQSLLPLGK